ncbi:MAG: hypothetical protein J6C96_12195 [Oscillospiraceae bacterium]|nr:hypothetical protein [Oscillospiraceae bacterium]
MKKYSKIIAAVCAAVIAVSALTGCSDSGKNGGDTTEATLIQNNTATTVSTAETDAPNTDIVTETRPLEEGDDYAINKINPKSPEGSFKGGYTMSGYDEENQGKLYNNGKSKIVIRAYNYNEDLQDMATWADSACAIIKISNVLNASSDTEFKEPENVKVCGFDGIKYDYDITTYNFNEDGTKADVNAIYKARAYYFYSEQDAYAIQFDTTEADWEEQSAAFEEFVADLEITKTEY